MTLTEIQKALRSSFRNGLYIRRPSFNCIELYISKSGKVWQIEKSNGNTFETEFMKYEFNLDDWEIV